MNWFLRQIYLSSKDSFKRIPFKKSSKFLTLLGGVAISSAYALYKTNEIITKGERPYSKSYARPKYLIPPYERIIEDAAMRDYEIPPDFCNNFENPDPFHQKMEKLVRRVQHRIALTLSIVENGIFKEDKWERKDGTGIGVVRYIQDGKRFEKGGINITISKGDLSEESRRHMIDKNTEVKKFLQSKKDQKVPFFAASISSVIHPTNPHAPTIHFNYRYFEIGQIDKNGHFESKHWWFGGGCDLTPSVLYPEDCKHFHSVYHRICEKFRKGIYKEYKRNCDEYFCIPYRREHRGIGGVFFDGLSGDKERIFDFVDEMANAFNEAYIPILIKRCEIPFNSDEKELQEIRRGRYAEFNVAIDRGTKFGRSRENANIEAIHISLPLKARFEYNRKVKTEAERRLMEVLRNPVEWIKEEK